jgi:murein DD-endopeptidase MepM/ murein hydrolase activator NlpD
VIEALGLRRAETDAGSGDAAPAAVYQPATVNDLRGEMTAALPKSASTETEKTADEESVSEAVAPEEASSAEADDVPAAVETFLETQAAYSDQEIPANVTYDMPELPFAHACPVSADISSGFGFRLHPIDDTVKFHYGADYGACSGADIHAFADGTVSMVGYDEGYGNYIIIDHGDGWQTQYCHCGTVYVSCGQSVSMGDKIALVGATGRVTGPHLHFEIRHNGVYYNPGYYTA